MAGEKQNYSFELHEDQMSFLKEMTEKYDTPDDGKTLRIMIEYIREEADLDTVFEEIRCNHCG